MPTILDIPGVVVGDDIAAQQTTLINRLRMECCVALTGIVGIIQDNILLNQRSVVGIKSRGLAALVWFKIEASLNLVRSPCLRDEIREVARDCRLARRVQRYRREIIQRDKRRALTDQFASGERIRCIDIDLRLGAHASNGARTAIAPFVVIRDEKASRQLRAPLRDQTRTIGSAPILVMRNIGGIPLIVGVLLAAVVLNNPHESMADRKSVV